MSELHTRQVLFAKLFAQLVTWAFDQGYEIKILQVLRTQAEADANAASGAGIAHSLHLQSLAGDVALFVAGEYKTDLESYRPLGEYWKGLHDLCCWGGDFERPDADHFSVTFQGVR